MDAADRRKKYQTVIDPNQGRFYQTPGCEVSLEKEEPKSALAGVEDRASATKKTKQWVEAPAMEQQESALEKPSGEGERKEGEEKGTENHLGGRVR